MTVIHGTLDPLFPWIGSIFKSVPHTVEDWRGFNGCNGQDPDSDEIIAIGIDEKVWQNCAQDSKVVQVRIDGGVHSWPPERMNPEQYIWNFFKSYL